MDVASTSTPTPQPTRDREWAVQFVASMSDHQRALLKQMYDMEQERRQKEQEQKQREQEEELAKQQQQAILDSLTRQIPITVDVVRASTPPESHASSSSSSQVGGSLEEDEETQPQLTVKDIVFGKLKAVTTIPTTVTHHRPSSISSAATTAELVRPYRPRSPRERVFFDQHIYIFDKTSFDHKKKFYRCERKNSCNARVHTPSDSSKVIHKIQVHNHEPPSAAHLAHWDIKIENMRSGFIYPLRHPGASTDSTTSSYPTSMLTPKSDIDGEESPERGATPSPMDILNKMVEQLQDTRKPVRICLPDNFKELGELEIRHIEMSLTRFLMKNESVRDELIRERSQLPVFFPEAKKSDLVLFVANYSKPDGEFHMVKCEERNERSIRTAIETHLNLTSSKSLMMNISSKINIPLSQQMIDEWKSEEFIRLDTSKSNHWKIHRVTSLE